MNHEPLHILDGPSPAIPASFPSLMSEFRQTVYQ